MMSLGAPVKQDSDRSDNSANRGREDEDGSRQSAAGASRRRKLRSLHHNQTAMSVFSSGVYKDNVSNRGSGLGSQLGFPGERGLASRQSR